MKDSQNTNTGTTIEEYLRGCVGFEVTDSAISTILIDRELHRGRMSARWKNARKTCAGQTFICGAQVHRA